ncbi:proline-rich protein PRCC-like isoform X2 [Gigantopelta aegis]|uniref:proline-rich protein PRCC-like isoform X2 n=1 Tax=Gigantopelta aegis TaxID=1735272 RepID=UPI001B88AED5|nr:proline-rich protein PRCC-like isoform X2 [Gigantopelta aegis]
MSLVAYNSSDESQSSDDDAESQAVKSQPGALTGRISDENEIASAPTSNPDKTDRPVGDFQPHNNNLSAVTSLKDLPAPACSQIPAEEDELEEDVQPKVSQISDAPKPPQKRAKQPARISIPAVQYSSDEDEDEPAKKKKKTATGKSGLFSLLPEPVHAAKKESNRILIPHTLSKKPQQKPDTVLPPVPQAKPEVKEVITDAPVTAAATSTAPHKYTTQFQAITGYYSDSDDEEDEEEGSSGNFFSLASKSVRSGPVASDRLPSLASASEESCVVSGTDNSTKDSVQEAVTESNVVPLQGNTIDDDELGKAGESGVTLTSTSTDPDGPLDFKPSVNQDAPLSFKSSLNAPVAYGLAGPFRAKPGPAYYSMHETTLSQELPSATYGQSHDQEEASELNQKEIAQYMEDEQFLRLQGKRRRGKEEINLTLTLSKRY